MKGKGKDKGKGKPANAARSPIKRRYRGKQPPSSSSGAGSSSAKQAPRPPWQRSLDYFARKKRRESRQQQGGSPSTRRSSSLREASESPPDLPGRAWFRDQAAYRQEQRGKAESKAGGVWQDDSSSKPKPSTPPPTAKKAPHKPKQPPFKPNPPWKRASLKQSGEAPKLPAHRVAPTLFADMLKMFGLTLEDAENSLSTYYNEPHAFMPSKFRLKARSAHPDKGGTKKR